MASRSRTQVYMKLRESQRQGQPSAAVSGKGHRRVDSTSKMLSSTRATNQGGSADTTSLSVAPEWVGQADDLSSDVSQIKIKLSELHALSGKALLPGFSSDEEDAEAEITNTVAEVFTLFKDAQGKIKQLALADTTGGDGGQAVITNNIQQRAARQLQELEQVFRKEHRSYIAKLKGQTIEDYRPDFSLNSSVSAGGNSYFGGSEEMEMPECVDPRFSAQQTLQLVMMDQMTAERERQINQVAESVSDLADIFKEIQVLVIDQGTVLDRIDYNIEQATAKIGEAEKEITKARDYQKKSKMMLCIYLLLLLCGMMLVVIALKKSA